MKKSVVLILVLILTVAITGCASFESGYGEEAWGTDDLEQALTFAGIKPVMLVSQSGIDSAWFYFEESLGSGIPGWQFAAGPDIPFDRVGLEDLQSLSYFAMGASGGSAGFGDDWGTSAVRTDTAHLLAARSISIPKRYVVIRLEAVDRNSTPARISISYRVF